MDESTLDTESKKKAVDMITLDDIFNDVGAGSYHTKIVIGMGFTLTLIGLDMMRLALILTIIT